MSSPKVSIVILNWNGKKDTMLCLNSLSKLRYDNFETIVVDNGSTDGSVESLHKQPGITFIENKKNIGFAAGNNVGIRTALSKNTDYVLLLNNDTVCDPDFLTHMVKTAESSIQTGIVCPKIYYFDQTDRIWSVGGKNIFRTVILGDPTKGKKDTAGRYQEDREIDYAWSCAMLIKRALLERIGLLDEDYFVSMEDIDYCKRAKDRGFSIYLSARAKVWHRVSSSTGGEGYTPIMRYYYGKGMALFMRKHARVWQWPLFFLIVGWSLLWAGFRETTRKNQKAIFSKIKGLKHGFQYSIR